MRADVDLKYDVIEAFAQNPAVSLSTIRVSVKDGVVSLTGCMSNQEQRLAAKLAAERVDGVKSVEVNIEVRPPDA